jgi:hypothetical protein
MHIMKDGTINQEEQQAQQRWSMMVDVQEAKLCKPCSVVT